MANDVHYVTVFVTLFVLLGLIAPFLNEEFSSDLSENDVNEVIPDEGEDYTDIDTTFGYPTEVVFLIANIFALPFWTFGFPVWLNLWFLLPIRIVFMFVVFRNVWIGGGG